MQHGPGLSKKTCSKQALALIFLSISSMTVVVTRVVLRASPQTQLESARCQAVKDDNMKVSTWGWGWALQKGNLTEKMHLKQIIWLMANQANPKLHETSDVLHGFPILRQFKLIVLSYDPHQTNAFESLENCVCGNPTFRWQSFRKDEETIRKANWGLKTEFYQ